MTCKEANLYIDLQQGGIRWGYISRQEDGFNPPESWSNQVHSKVVGLPQPARRVTLVISLLEHHMLRGVYKGWSKSG